MAPAATADSIQAQNETNVDVLIVGAGPAGYVF